MVVVVFRKGGNSRLRHFSVVLLRNLGTCDTTPNMSKEGLGTGPHFVSVCAVHYKICREDVSQTRSCETWDVVTWVDRLGQLGLMLNVAASPICPNFATPTAGYWIGHKY